MLSIAKKPPKESGKKYSEQFNKLMLICLSLESLILQSQALLKGTKELQLLWLLRKLNVLSSASLDWNLGHQKSSDRLQDLTN